MYKDNYYALLLSIVTQNTPEQSFSLLNNDHKQVYREKDVRDMVILNELGCTTKKISKMYNLNHEYTKRLIREWDYYNGFNLIKEVIESDGEERCVPADICTYDNCRGGYQELCINSLLADEILEFEGDDE